MTTKTSVRSFVHDIDKIDLTDLLGATDLVWGGTTPTPKGVWISHTGSGPSARTHVWADTSGDLTPDLHIVLIGNISIDQTDFRGVSVRASNRTQVAMAGAAS